MIKDRRDADPYTEIPLFTVYHIFPHLSRHFPEKIHLSPFLFVLVVI